MMGFSIITMDKDDTTGGFKLGNEPMVEGIEGRIAQAAVMENGITSGKDSVALDIVMPNGKHVIVQTSVDLLDGLLSAARGASQRWRGQ